MQAYGILFGSKVFPSSYLIRRPSSLLPERPFSQLSPKLTTSFNILLFRGILRSISFQFLRGIATNIPVFSSVNLLLMNLIQSKIHVHTDYLTTGINSYLQKIFRPVIDQTLLGLQRSGYIHNIRGLLSTPPEVLQPIPVVQPRRFGQPPFLTSLSAHPYTLPHHED